MFVLLLSLKSGIWMCCTRSRQWQLLWTVQWCQKFWSYDDWGTGAGWMKLSVIWCFVSAGGIVVASTLVKVNAGAPLAKPLWAFNLLLNDFYCFMASDSGVQFYESVFLLLEIWLSIDLLISNAFPWAPYYSPDDVLPNFFQRNEISLKWRFKTFKQSKVYDLFILFTFSAKAVLLKKWILSDFIYKFSFLFSSRFSSFSIRFSKFFRPQ